MMTIKTNYPETNKSDESHVSIVKIRNFFSKSKNKFCEYYKKFTGYDIENINTFDNFVKWLHRPTDAAALGIFRMLFGIAMLIDIPEERQGGNLDIRFGEPKHCHFPLFNFIQPLGLPQMGIVYLLMWLGALGIALGYKFKLSCLMFLIPYWYIFLLEKPAWNNHSYLYGLCGFLLLWTSANRYCAIDGRKLKKDEQIVPYWNYFIIKFQFFILYFMAGLKKMTIEWLSGYAMTNLGYHWVFRIFRYILSVEMTELLIIHWFTAIFDLTIAFWMTYEKTRLLATPFMLSFHLMNSRLFTIGMFPWVCLAEVHLFFKVDWPRTIFRKNFKNDVKKDKNDIILLENNEKKEIENKMDNTRLRLRRKSSSKQQANENEVTDKTENSSIEQIPSKPFFIQKLRVLLILCYCALQCFLPYSHFITKGYNNWTNGIYGYSWDMMVHSYDTILTSIKIVDNNNGKTHYLEPYAFSEYDRWTKHADMAVQYAKCIERNLIDDYQNNPRTILTSTNLSIYFDVWCSMNGRFQQRVFDPRVDLLKAEWSPFKKTEWVLPLLNELNYLRPKLNAITNDVLSWNNHSDVMFIADFPQLTLENFISSDLDNVTLTVLDGAIRFKDEKNEKTVSISFGQSLSIKSGEFHQITTISQIPSCYMYTFLNKTMQELQIEVPIPEYDDRPILPLWNEFFERAQNYKNFLYNVGNSIMYLVYGVPMPIRIRELD